MADFLTRLVERTMQVRPAIEPAITSIYAQPQDERYQEMPPYTMGREEDKQLLQASALAREPQPGAVSPSPSPHLSPALQEAADLSLSPQAPISSREVQRNSASQPLPSPIQPIEEQQRSVQEFPAQLLTSQIEAAPTAQATMHHTEIQTSALPTTPATFQKNALIASVEIAHEPVVPEAFTPTGGRIVLPDASSSQVPTSDPQSPAVEQAAPSVQQRTLHDEHLTTHITHTTSIPVSREPVARVREGAYFIEDQKRLLQKSSGLQAPVSQDETIPTIQVMIGRIEVQVTPSPITPAAQSSRQKPMSLDHYLEQRGKGDRS